MPTAFPPPPAAVNYNPDKLYGFEYSGPPDDVAAALTALLEMGAGIERFRRGRAIHISPAITSTRIFIPRVFEVKGTAFLYVDAANITCHLPATLAASSSLA